MSLVETTSLALRALFKEPSTLNEKLPITSADLLSHIVAWQLSNSRDHRGRWRLGDVHILDDVMQGLAQHWEHGRIELLNSEGAPNSGKTILVRVTMEEAEKKRKRTDFEEEPPRKAAEKRNT